MMTKTRFDQQGFVWDEVYILTTTHGAPQVFQHAKAAARAYLKVTDNDNANWDVETFAYVMSTGLHRLVGKHITDGSPVCLSCERINTDTE